MATISYIDKTTCDSSSVTMRLYGTIGDKVDGDYFAQELSSLARDYELVNLRINSPGGDVMSGMSIVSAMLSVDTPINVYIDGVAASMAAVIAVCGDRVYMADYAKLMIHDPYFADGNAPSAKQKKQLTKIREMLGQVLSRRGKNIDDVAKLMSAETWFSADEAQAAGLCDEIVTSAKTPMAGLTPLQICAKINDDYIKTNQLQNEMKLNAKVAGLLGVTAEAPEAEISAAIEKMAADKAVTDKIAAQAVAAKQAAEEELKEIKEKQAAEQKSEAERLIDTAVKDGRINADGKQALLKVFAQDHTAGLATLAAIPVRNPLSAQIKTGASAASDLCSKSWDELDKEGRLGTLKTKYPDVYRDKFNAKFHPDVEE